MYIAEMRDGATLGKARQSEYMTVSGACFINQSSPVMTISKNGIRFSKACHSRLDDCEYVELLYHPIQVLLEANGLAAGKDHQFKGRYDAEKNAVIISLEKDEQSALSPQKCTT